jgi:hypothetical protein
MAEISRLQLESRDVSRGRTALGAAGAIQRTGVEAAESSAQSVLVASTLAAQAIQTGRADLEKATSIIKQIDERYGAARRKAAAQQTVSDAVIEADERVQALFNDQNLDPLSLAAEADKALLDIRNKAGGQAAGLGPEEQAFVLQKLDALRAGHVSKARQEGYKREGDQRRAGLEDMLSKNRLRMYSPSTTMAERTNILNDTLNAITSHSFYLGEETAEKMRNKEILGFKRQAFIEQYMVNPNKALEELPLAGFGPEEESLLRDKALRELERIDRKERQDEADDEADIARKNDEMFNLGTVGAISLDQLRSEAIKDPSLAPSLRKLEAYVAARQRHAKAMAGEGARRARTAPGVLKALFNKILRGEYQNMDQVIEETDELFLERDLSESDALRVMSQFQNESKKQKSEKAKEFNLEVKDVSADLTSMIAPVHRVTGKRDGQAFNLAKSLESQIVQKGIQVLQENQEPNTPKIVDDVVQENLPTIATTLEGKTLKDINGVFGSVEEAEKAGVTGEELTRIQFQDRLIKAAAEQNAKTTKQRLEAERLQLEKEQARLQAEQRERIGEEAFKRQEERRVARQTEQTRRQSLEEKLMSIDVGSKEFDSLAEAELNRLHGGNIKNVDRNTLAIQRDRMRQSLSRQRRSLLQRRRRQQLREAAGAEVSRQQAIQAADQKMEQNRQRLKQLNDSRNE